MISIRGPKRVLVSDRTAVPVRDICSSTLHCEKVETILQRYPITEEEYFEALDIFVDNFGPNDSDFVEIECNDYDGDIQVDTVGISDWVYITCIVNGKDIEPSVTDLTLLYVIGIEAFMLDCLIDFRDKTYHYKHSDIHNLIFESFLRAYGKPLEPDVDVLIDSLQGMINEDEMDEQ